VTQHDFWMCSAEKRGFQQILGEIDRDKIRLITLTVFELFSTFSLSRLASRV
jgi:hypothetical protein